MIYHLAPRLCAGKIIQRKDILADVTKYHIARGGLPCKAKEPLRVTGKALRKLKKEGLVKELQAYGMWQFPEAALGDLVVPETADNGQEPPHRIEAERQLGRGSQVVYMFTYPAYIRLAELEGRDTWRVKIGQSGKPDGLARVIDQCREAAPEWPVVHIVIYTDAARKLERFLHDGLTMQDRWLDAPGKDWFDASPDLVMRLIEPVLSGV